METKFFLFLTQKICLLREGLPPLTCHVMHVTVSYVTCHMSNVKCHMSCVTIYFYFFDKFVTLVCGGYVINKATLSTLFVTYIQKQLASREYIYIYIYIQNKYDIKCQAFLKFWPVSAYIFALLTFNLYCRKWVVTCPEVTTAGARQKRQMLPKIKAICSRDAVWQTHCNISLF